MTRIKMNPDCFLKALLLVLLSAGAISEEPDFTELLKNKLSEFNKHYPEERAYILTDRYLYRPGEELWFKAFVVSKALEPSLQYSSDLFVRLVGSNGEEIINRRYPLEINESEGRIVIPRSCIPGRYWLVGYTGWMKNQVPEEAFRKEILISKYFEKRFTVQVMYDKFIYNNQDTLIAHIQILDPSGKPVSETSFNYSIGSLDKSEFRGDGITDIKGKAKITGIIPESDELVLLNIELKSHKLWGDFSTIVPVYSKQPDITFYPEGGELVTGYSNLVAIKAENKYGMPLSVQGVITNAKGAIVQTVSTGGSGIGKFEVIPGADTLFFMITNPEKSDTKYMLPLARNNGPAIHYIGSDEKTAFFSINTNNETNTRTYWVTSINRNIAWSGKHDCRQTDTLKIPLDFKVTTLMQVTVFDEFHKLIYDRMINIRRDNPYKVKIQKNNYLNRQRVNVQIEFPKNLDNLVFSVALDRLAHYPLNNNEDNYFAYAGSGCSFNDLDLLATSCRMIYWNEVLGISSGNVYRKQDGLSGIVKDKKDNASQHAKIRVTHFPSFGVYETQSDENGAFNIDFGSEIIDFRFLNVEAYDALGKTSLNAAFDDSYVKKLNSLLDEESRKNIQQKIRDIKIYGEQDLVYVLRYGPGKFRNSKTEKRKKYDPYAYSKYTDIMDIIQDIQPYKLAGNKIIFTERVKNRMDSIAMEEAIIVINGSLKGNDISVLKTIVPSDITNINISNYLIDVHKYTPLNFGSVIEITTIQSLYKYRQPNLQMGPGFLSTERAFYSPDYSLQSSSSVDNRRTLYWNPKITPKEGNSIVITFFTSDVKGVFYGKIFGINQQGMPVQDDFTIKVE